MLASWLRRMPVGPTIWRWRSQTHGENEAAAQGFREAIALDPQNLPARVRLGEVLLDAGDPEAAREALEQALELDPDCALAHYFLARSAVARGEPAEAVEHFERTAQLQPTASVFRYPFAQALSALGRTAEAAEQIELMGSEEVRLPDPNMVALEDLHAGAAAFIRRGARAQIDGAWEAAREEYRKAVAADPNNPEARQGLAASMAQLGDLEGALDQYRKALELGEGNALVRFNLAGALALTGRQGEAVEQYRRVLEIDPNHREAPFNLARVLAEDGRGQEAEQAYRDILRRRPNSVRAHRELAAVLAGGGDVAAARQLLNQALALDLTAAEVGRIRLEMAELVARHGDTAEGLALFREAAEENPEDPSIWFRLANLSGQHGRFGEAAAAYRKVLELDPEQGAARLGEATALNLSGRSVEARKRLEEGLAASPNNGDLAHALARLLATGRQAGARDGAKALELARAVYEASGSLEAAETVALALAESERFAEAIDWQKRVVESLAAAGAPAGRVDLARSYLAQFEAGRPVRQ